MGTALTWYGAIGLLTTEGRWPVLLSAALSLSGAILAIGARGDGAAFIGAAVLGAALWTIEQRRQLSWRIKAISAVVVTVLLYLAFRSGNSRAVIEGIEPAAESTLSAMDLLIHNILHLPRLILGVFGYSSYLTGGYNLGGLGWLDTPVPPLSAALMIVALGMLVAFAFGLRDAVRSLAVFFFLALLVVGSLFSLSQSRHYVGAFIQPRYFLPLVFLVIAAMVTPRGKRMVKEVSRLQRLFLGAVLTIAHSAALYLCLVRYVIGYGSYPLVISVSDSRWWWDWMIPPTFVWLFGSLAFGVLIHVSSKELWGAKPSDEIIPSA